MRPVELVMQGFGPFRDLVTVDFADTELIAIVGATGHGKSSIIDAMCFALYGRVPRHGDKDIAPVITLGAAEARVVLTFTLGPHRYLASRIVRRNADGSGAKTRAVRLEQVNPDGTTEILAGSVREFDPHVRGLLGLDFDQFTKCVVLPQGRFAALLQATSGERSAILGALLGLHRYERMARAARERAGWAQGSREALELERSRGLQLDEPARAAQVARRDALAELLVEIDSARAADARLHDDIERSRREGAAARTTLAALTQVRVDPAIEPRAQAIAQASEALDTVVAEAVAAEARDVAATAALDGLPPLEVLTSALEAHVEREKVVARIANGTDMHAKVTTQLAAARDEHATAQQAVTVAEAALADAHVRHAHAELRAGLVVGEPCPVCDQTVESTPPRIGTAASARAEKALDKAKAAARAAQQTLDTHLAELHRVEATLDTVRQQQADLDAKIAAHPDRAALSATVEEVRARRDAARAARAELARHTEALAEAKHRVDAATTALGSGETAYRNQRDQLVKAGLAVPEELDAGLLERWAALAAFAADELGEAEKRAIVADEQVASFVTERDTQFARLRAQADTLGAEPRAATVADLAAEVTGAQRDAAHAVEQAERQLARAAELERDIAAARADEQVAGALGRLLDGRHFRQWIVDEALRSLVTSAGAVLGQLSSGQYSLAVTADADLLVVDHANADETRSVNSLSGGETFQASLALALALADRVSELAGHGTEPLESIFLDEGFGSLDPETLDVVAGTIESLARDDRLVGVVTHVRELAERMPVRFRVRKEPGTSVVTREES